MKTKEELTALREKVETLNKKLNELTEDELEQVSGGAENPFADVPPGTGNDENKLTGSTISAAIEKLTGDFTGNYVENNH